MCHFCILKSERVIEIVALNNNTTITNKNDTKTYKLLLKRKDCLKRDKNELRCSFSSVRQDAVK